MDTLKIYLGDLTYTTLSIATEAFPLNIGYVGAYCREQFGDQVDITLFKYIDDLDHAIHESPPDILALSNYPWNLTVGIELFNMMRIIRPETLCIMGGSNIPHQAEGQAKFMKARPMIDAYVYLEGEIGFSNIVEKMIQQKKPGPNRAWLKKEPINGCLFISDEGNFVRGPVILRQKALDEFPSPYLTGLFDKFFDGQLSPMVETNRGCPFSCTFCHEGHSIFQKVNFFSMERVQAELEYIAERVPPEVHNLMFCDPNFGMYHRDVDICKIVRAIKAKRGWPKDIFASTGKNNKDRVASALHELEGSMQLWLSVQSMDQTVLDNIKRTNIGLKDMINIQSSLTENNLPSLSEIILGLPGETYESHLKTISDLVTAGVDSIEAYTLMLLDGTYLNTPEEKQNWGFISKFRVLPRDFGKLSNGKNTVEIEEVAVGTKDLPFDDYIIMRRFHFIISTIYNGKAFASLFKFFAQQGLQVFPLLKEVLERISEAPLSVQKLVAQFEQETRDELWDSEEELRNFFDHDENYDRLISGKLGANLLQKYVALSLSQTPEDWAKYVFMVARDILAQQLPNGSALALEKLDNIQRYCSARVHNLFGTNRLTDIPEEVLDYDLEAWGLDIDARLLDGFRYPEPTRTRFIFTNEQYRTTEDYIARFGRTHQGIGKILTKMSIRNAWRKCVRADEVEEPSPENQAQVFYTLINEQASGGVIARE